MAVIRPKPEDVEEFARLIAIRESAHLAHITSDPFTLFNFNGTEGVLVSPGRAKGENVAKMRIRRLEDLGVLRIIDRSANGYTFDLVDDYTDRLEEMRVALGQPSRMGELEASVALAEAAAKHSEAERQRAEADSAAARGRRADLRSDFAGRVGRRVLLVARVALGAFYIGAIAVAGYLVSANLPVPFVVAVIGITISLAALDWLLHIDGFALAANLEARAVKRALRWLESFDPEA